jgi:hypothetical protein
LAAADGGSAAGGTDDATAGAADYGREAETEGARMPVITLLIYIVLVALLGFLAVWVLGKLAPGHPAMIDNVIWVIVVLVIVLEVLSAFGLLGAGPLVPRLR